MTTLAEALQEIETALPKVLWQRGRVDSPDGFDARGYEGDADGWRFVIAIWRILPKEMANHDTCDGAASKGGLIIRLPHAIAMRAAGLAEP